MSQAPRVLHDAVGHREVRCRVVELDVAVEGRPAGEDGRCREGGEGRDRRSDRPRAMAAAPGRHEQEPRYG